MAGFRSCAKASIRYAPEACVPSSASLGPIRFRATSVIEVSRTTRAPSLERCPGGYQEAAAVFSRAFSVSFCDVVRAGPARLVQVFGWNRSGERPAPLSCQDAHFSKNSQEGGKFGRKSYENLLPVFSPSCKFWQFFRGFTRERLRLVALVRLFFSDPSSRSPTQLLNRTAWRYTSSFS
jgi:hypothetical protein